MHIVIYGSPRDGFYFHGPFEHFEDALSYAEQQDGESVWWIAELQTPEQA